MSLYPGSGPFLRGTIPDGDEGIKATLLVMVTLARDYSRDPGILSLLAELLRGEPPGRMYTVKALHAFVRDKIRYTEDPKYTELVRTPPATLRQGIGDCDDEATLLGTLLTAANIGARFRAVAFAPSQNFSHVFTEARVGKGWLPLETIVTVEPGWLPPGISRSMYAHI
jgi:transglutaminase-like putative cysteine protease